MSSQFVAANQNSDGRSATFAGLGLSIEIRPQATYPHTFFNIRRSDGRTFSEPLYYSHLGLGQMLTQYTFSNVLEIGARDGIAARAFEFCGKEVFAIDINDNFSTGFSGDYLDYQPPKLVDAIWCSHVLEHQRHLGRFVEKMYDDLADDGVLALTVPSALSPLLMGHCNIFTGMHLIYHLVLAGFDCSDASFKYYDWQMTVIVRKKPNNVPRISFATTSLAPIQRIGYVENLISFFPKDVQSSFDTNGIAWGEIEEINWK